jgi:hypothetical protein
MFLEKKLTNSLLKNYGKKKHVDEIFAGLQRLFLCFLQK